MHVEEIKFLTVSKFHQIKHPPKFELLYFADLRVVKVPICATYNIKKNA